MTTAPPSLDELYALRVLREVDVHFARAAARIAGATDPLVLLGLAVASRAPGAGHVCADLRRPHRTVRVEDDRVAAIAWPAADAWIAALRRSAVVGDGAALRRLLVLDGDRLYLDRYWRYQRRLVDALTARAGVVRDDVDEDVLRAGLDRLFPVGRDADGSDRQRAAACVAVLRSLAVVTGGPGTGKTTTVVKILALLAEQARAAAARPPRIALAAPTGKAAARMVDAIRAGVGRLEVDDVVRQAIPTAASTIHRLLGVDPRRPTRFLRDAASPLPADVVVVDEVSMVDLALMAKLLDAVPPSARLILLGDRDQLVSVEAGAILGDICDDGGRGPSTAFADRLRLATGAAHPELAAGDEPGLRDCVVRLTRSHRFGEGSGIGALARAVNAGDADAALDVLQGAGPTVYDRRSAGSARLLEPEAGARDARAIRDVVVDGYQACLTAAGPAEVLVKLDGFRVLCAHREGALGVRGLNDAVAGWLEAAGLLRRADGGEGGWYHRRPIIVTENDPQLNLYNGDTGVILEVDGRPRAFFRTPDGAGVRSITPTRLPAHESVFAMTVHKSQGSEFDHVVLVLPSRPSPVLTRELLYTGITRARTSVLVVGSPAVLRAAVAERVQRASGLRERLWGEASGPVSEG